MGSTTLSNDSWVSKGHTHWNDIIEFSGKDWISSTGYSEDTGVDQVRLASNRKQYLANSRGELLYTNAKIAATNGEVPGPKRHSPPDYFPGISLKNIKIQTEYVP